jgi:hypothetical protein
MFLKPPSRLRPYSRHTCCLGRFQFARFALQTGCMLLAAVLGVVPLWPQATPSVEYQVKAAFLFNFAKFIEWPPESFPTNLSPITFCVFGHDPFGEALSDVIRGKTINARELQARGINDLPNLKACHLVFVSDREDKHLSEILSSVKASGVLVVGEAEGFTERGGTVQLFLENNKLRFAVNVDAAKRARLQVSSKLLALARIVHDSNHGKGN